MPLYEGDNSKNNLTGSIFADTLRGFGGNDLLRGLEGDDVLNGGGGFDTIREQDDVNFILTDTSLIGLGMDTLISIERAILRGGTSDQIIDASNFSGSTGLHGYAGHDTIIGGIGNDYIDGDSGNDSLEGGDGDDTINGGDGDDTLDGRNGDDVLNGGDGDDQLAGRFGNDSLNGENGDDTLRGSIGDNTLHGGRGNDQLISGVGNDILNGNQGDDFFLIVQGDNTVNGGDGYDVLSGSGQNFLEGADLTLTDNSLNGLGNNTLVSIEAAILFAGAGDRIIDATGFSGNVEARTAEGDDTLLGGEGDDKLLGRHGHDHLEGNEGNDTLDGFSGQDFLQGGDGNDSLEGGNGFDTLEGGSGADSLLGGNLIDVLSGGAGNDYIDGGLWNDLLYEQGDVSFILSDNSLLGLGQDSLKSIENAHLVGGVGNNALSAISFSGQVTLEGRNGNDQLHGSAQNDLLRGQAGNDILRGGRGDDTLNGGTGNIDHLVEMGDVNFVLTDSSLTGLGTDLLVSIEEASLSGGFSSNSIDARNFSGRVNLNGGGGGDLLYGAAGNDYIRGNQGDDIWLWGLDGDDTLNGGSGSDRVYEEGNTNFVLTNTSLTGRGTDTLISIERATIHGGGSHNILDASSFTKGDVALYGFSGNDTLSGGRGDDTLHGGAGTNQLSQTGDVSYFLTDTSLSGLGDDSLINIQQAELIGGASNNSFRATMFSGSVVFRGGEGNDQFFGAQGNDLILGEAGNDLLQGNEGDDTLNGGAGWNDRLYETGDVDFELTDTSLVGLGTDTLISIEKAILIGGEGANSLNATEFSGETNLIGGAGNDILFGSSVNSDRLNGGADNDVLFGHAGDDSLTGSSGNDQLIGGIGKDKLTGGAGSDEFIFFHINHLGDEIHDWTAIDTLTVHKSGFNPTGGASDLMNGYQTPVFANADLGNQAGFRYYEFASGIANGGDLFFDQDGGSSDSGLVFIAHFSNIPDFLALSGNIQVV